MPEATWPTTTLRPTPTGGFTVTGIAHDGTWDATDQIPKRAVDDGTLDRFGAADPTSGGRSFRYALTADWRTASGARVDRLRGQVVRYGLDIDSELVGGGDAGATEVRRPSRRAGRRLQPGSEMAGGGDSPYFHRATLARVHGVMR